MVSWHTERIIANSLQIPLITCECDPNNYVESFEEGLNKAKTNGRRFLCIWRY